MFDATLRPFLVPLLRRPAQALAGRGVTPNQVSIAGFVLALMAAAAVASGRPVLGMGAWILGRYVDGLDGMVARLGGMTTGFGGYLDITLDMAAYSLMVVAFAVIHPEHSLLWLCILLGYVLCITTTTALSSILEQRRVQIPGNDRSLQFTAGIAESGETTVFYLLLTTFPASVTWLGWTWVMLLMATAVQRTALARRLLGG